MGHLCPVWSKTATPYITIYPTLRTFLRHCSIIRHNSYKIEVLANFPPKNLFFKQKNNLHPIWPKIFQPYIS